MESLSHEIMNESAFDIASSMIQGDLNSSLMVDPHDISNDVGHNGYRNHQDIDYGDDHRLVVDEDDLFSQVASTSIASGECSSNLSMSMSTRLRRRKASQPQRLVYCDLDFNAQEEEGSASTVNDNSLDANSPVKNVDDFNTNAKVSNEEPSPSEPEINKSCNNGKGFKCEICGSVWNNKSRLKCHYRTHGASKHLKCNICGKLFGWEYSWKTHMLAHSEQNPNKCPHCGVKLFNKTALSNHIKRIHQNPERPFKCSVCNKSFISKSELNQHSFIHNQEKSFMCELCGKTFRSKSYMERHFKTHTGIKPFDCPHCGKKLADKTGFTAHIRAHQNVRPYVCPICNKTYTIKRHLTSHLIIHSDARPFKCDLCEKTFRSRTNFRMHKDSHLGIKRWSCKFCNRSFLSQGNMAKHVRRHIGDRKHKCEICGKAFIEKQELKNHSKMHANDKVKKSKKAKSAAVESPAVPNPSDCQEPNKSDQINGNVINSETISTIENALTNNVNQELDNGNANLYIPPINNFANHLYTFQETSQTNFLNSDFPRVFPSFQTFVNDSNLSPTFLNCTLCSHVFSLVNQLKDHMLDFHRVEPEKVFSLMY